MFFVFVNLYHSTVYCKTIYISQFINTEINILQKYSSFEIR